MKSTLFFIMLLISQISFAQKMYINREGISRLTKKMEACKLLEKKLIYTSNQVVELRNAIVENEIEFEYKLSKLDSIIAIAEHDYIELEKKYQKALELIPKRKRKYL